MNKIILATFITFFNLSFCFSQDMITKRTGEDIQAKILEVDQNEYRYKKFDDLNGPTYTIPKSEVLMVRYQNGAKDIFNEAKRTESGVSPVTSSNDLFIKGQSDATRFYRGYSSAGAGTLIVSLLSPLVGLIPAIACSSTPPKEINLNYPDRDLMKNSDYKMGYIQRSKKIKQGKVWKNWWIALGVNVVVVLITTAGK